VDVSAAGKASRSFDLDFLRGLFVLGILVYHIVPGAPVGLGQGSMEGFFILLPELYCAEFHWVGRGWAILRSIGSGGLCPPSFFIYYWSWFSTFGFKERIWARF
jgi:hypothetical protein